jgi:5-methylcytosine-specific restriction enzyme A
MGKRKSLAPCAARGCPTLTRETYCPSHKPAPWSGRTWADTREHAPEWQRLSRRTKRAEPSCRLCGRPTVAAHHILPRAWYPQYFLAPENIAGLCRQCDQHTTQVIAREGRRRAALEAGQPTSIPESDFRDLVARLAPELVAYV